MPIARVGGSKKHEVKQPVDPYVVSFEVEPFRQGKRHHWMICRSQNPDELVSWGHAPTRELAETAAKQEVQDLSSGRTQGGPAASVVPLLMHRTANGHY